MLPRQNRLRRRSEVGLVRNAGRRWRHPLAILLVYAQDVQPNNFSAGVCASRFAFSASRRVGKAVDRNRAKRLMREAVRLQINDIRPGFDCLFIARSTTVESSFVEVFAAVNSLLSRARLLDLK